MSEEDFRQIDIELIDKDICEKKLHEKSGLDQPNMFFDIYSFIAGLAIGGIISVSLLNR